MKLAIFFLIYLLACNGFAYKESYHVYGYDENGALIQGTVNTKDEDWEVAGQLTHSDGDSDDFYGRWNGPGQITGQTDEGEVIDLKTY